MTRHIFKIVWNRKRANSLVTLELFIAFLVLFGLAAAALYNVSHFRRPLGFEIEDVWAVTIATQNEDEGILEHSGETFRNLLTGVESFEEVESIAGLTWVPYRTAGWRTSMKGHDDSDLSVFLMSATDKLPDVMGLNVVQGRWFEESDAGLERLAVVVNRRLAEAKFGDEDPIGQIISDEEEDSQGEEDSWPQMTVVGVIDDYRNRGEFDLDQNVLFMHGVPDAQNDWTFMESLVIRVKPGTPPAFEAPLAARLEATAPEWSFRIQPVAAARQTYLRKKLAPLVIFALVASFLIIMVTLGLVGVLWQNVTQRLRELGLRRAKGATARRIHRQILAELSIMTGFAIVAGGLAIAQIPIIGWFPHLNGGIYALAFFTAAIVLSILTLVSGLYPSWLATRVQPAEALHWE